MKKISALLMLVVLACSSQAQNTSDSATKKYQAKAPPTRPFGKEGFQPSNTTTIRWLGMAGFLVNSRGTTFMVDPLLEGYDMPLLMNFPIKPKDVPRLDAVFVTHSDNDHYSFETFKDLAPVTMQFHSTVYVDSLMKAEGLRSFGHFIGDTFRVGKVAVRLTLADHAWQNDFPQPGQRYYEPGDACGFWFNTPDGSIWAPSDSRFMQEQLHMPTPDAILFFYSEDALYHSGLEGAVKIANAYPNTPLILGHWGFVNAPDFTPFNGDPKNLSSRVVNPARIIVLAPGQPFTLKGLKKSKAIPAETFSVTSVPAENGSYTISPKIPKNGKVPVGTVLRVNAKPASAYSLDAIYHTVKGGMWGTTSYESFSSKTTITVNKDMTVGATFIPRSLVDNVNVTQDVVYAKPGIKPLKYDVYSPKGAKNLPCIIIIHGGGWSSNNEDIMRGLARELVKGGRYVVFSIDYRWINKLDGETQATYMHRLIEDVFGAIAHIQEHAAQYGGDSMRIAVTGDSAGGHLAEAAATLSPLIGDGGFGVSNGVYQFMPTYLPKQKSLVEVKNEITSAIKAVAPSYGPSDAADFTTFLEQKDQGYWDAISPVRHVPQVSERMLPHFIVRGTEDPIVPHAVVQRYVDVLKAAGQPVNYIQVQGAGHAFFDCKPDAVTSATFARYGVPYAAQMQSFFNSIFYER